MNLIDVLITLIGPTFARFLLVKWLGDTFVAEELTGSIGEIISKLNLDKRTQNKAERVFSDIGEEIAESLVAMFDLEGIDFSDDRKRIVADAVAETLPKLRTDLVLNNMLIKFDLQPDTLSKYLLREYPHKQDLDDSEQQLYQRIVVEACRRIIAVSTELPNFQLSVFSDLLKRSRHLESTAEIILEKLNHLYEDSFNKQEGVPLQEKRFEHNYRQAIARKLDYVELIGLDIRSQTNHKQPLSVAYITLNLRGNELDDQDISASTALGNAHRLFIVGEAGSGKTTLLKWIAVRSANNDFEQLAPEMKTWEGTIPFFIRLRDFAGSEKSFPTPDEWPKLISPIISETMPIGWVHEQLENGRAVVLVDGLDELSFEKQQLAHEWLDEIMKTYFRPRYIVSSRPESMNEKWNYIGIDDYQLPQTPIQRFLDSWEREIGPIEAEINEQWQKEEQHRDEYQSQLAIVQARRKNSDNSTKKSQITLSQDEKEIQILQNKIRSLKPYSYFENQKQIKMKELFKNLFGVFKDQLQDALISIWMHPIQFPEQLFKVSETRSLSKIKNDENSSSLSNLILTEGNSWLQWAKNVWMPTLHVQRMSDQMIDKFVIHWHAALAVAEGNLPIQQKQMEDLSNQFIEALNENSSIRDLATTPLLCAMLCALHRERQQDLPKDRINLYQACLDAMLGFRDEKRGVDLTDYPNLSKKQKRYLLQDLAYWMMRNGYTASAPKSVAEQRIENRLSDLIATENIQSKVIIEYFIDRTGIIREPLVDQIDFAHRTFQEFLCAEAIESEGDIRAISPHFSDNEWHEVIVLLAGLVNKQNLDWMLNEMLSSNLKTATSTNSDTKRRIHLLALDCLSTDPILDDAAQKAIQKHSLAARPPKSSIEAALFAKARDLAIPSLRYADSDTDEEVLYMTEALITINSDSALKQLTNYVNILKDKLPAGKPTPNKDFGMIQKVNFEISGNLPTENNLGNMLGGTIRARLTSRNKNKIDLKIIRSHGQTNAYIAQAAMHLYEAWSAWNRSELFAKCILQPLIDKTKYLLLKHTNTLTKALDFLDLTHIEHIEFEDHESTLNWDEVIKHFWNLNYLTEISFNCDVEISSLLPLTRLPRIRRINVPITTKLTNNIKLTTPFKHFDEV